ncbi:exosortase-associated protein EpsI, B-type [Rhodocyclus tenuis]|uniref:exosortase-associated protein EpsI, B-type n=1 Tax=Rhodocyclus tenuis TaxID=1066 RepID=UPI001906C97F|nr:exosortase-associated protein EpsI, B-type [Rhodocyclus tenuis]MBK1678901.1 EpsI family protein [Rhodocyclus tenuis]
MNVWLRNSILLALMLAASGLAFALRPTQKMADQGPKVDLERMIPSEFAEWREEKQNATLIVDPQQQATIDRLYSQTLSRTYMNDHGYRIMLSIAYGTDQRESQVHTPEVCYPAQGFTLHNKEPGSLALDHYSIPVVRVVSSLGQRIEPVTYWTTIGDQVIKRGIHKRTLELAYGLAGQIPDGMIVRVSSIDPEATHAYEMQGRFAAQMLAALAPEYRQRFAGTAQAN